LGLSGKTASGFFYFAVGKLAMGVLSLVVWHSNSADGDLVTLDLDPDLDRYGALGEQQSYD
jgi:hypothetical protein